MGAKKEMTRCRKCSRVIYADDLCWEHYNKSCEGMTPEEADKFQSWESLDGAEVFALIQRHADGWDDIRVMMDAWLKANTVAMRIDLNRLLENTPESVTDWHPLTLRNYPFLAGKHPGQRRHEVPAWRLLEGADLPQGTPVNPNSTIYAFDERGTWVYRLPALPD